MEGAAMGSLASPKVANLYMEHFEGEVLRSASYPPGIGIVYGWHLGHSITSPQTTFLGSYQQYRYKYKVHSQR